MPSNLTSISFTPSPALGQTYTYSNQTYQWNGTEWVVTFDATNVYNPASVLTTGNQTITGVKTFSNDLVATSQLGVYGTTRLTNDLIIGNQSGSGNTGSLRLTQQLGLTYIQSGLNVSSLSAAPLVFCAIGGGPEWMRLTSTGLSINPNTASSSTSTGALVVSGGVGIAGSLNIGGGVVADNIKLNNSASTNANTLDFYEEGTFTPKYQYWKNSVWTDLVATYTAGYTTGRYTRIGNIIYWTVEMYTTARTDPGATYLAITGFPSAMTGGGDVPRSCAFVGYCNGFTGYAPTYLYSDGERYYLCGGAYSINTVYLTPSHIGSGTTHLMVSGIHII
jgi:hypothetical protein